jgi:hypothetical protein
MNNERLIVLANECTSYKEGLIEGKHDIEVFDKEKFAELIVRECCDVLYDNELGGYQVNYVLKEHFGVE